MKLSIGQFRATALSGTQLRVRQQRPSVFRHGAAPRRVFAAAGRRSGSSSANSYDELQRAEAEAQRAADDLNSGLDAANARAQSMAAGRGGNGDVQGEMLKPSPANKPLVRSLAVAGAIALAARSTGFLPARAAAFTHLLAWGILLGSNFYTTFILGIVMFKNLPRQTFGKLQSKLFPIFFALNGGAAAVALATLLYSGVGALRQQKIALGVVLGGSLLQGLALEPHTTKLMFDRYELENVEGARDNERITSLRKAFGKWHGISSTVNLAVFAAAVAHGWYLAASLLRLAI